jgi:lipoprotein NlpI
VYQDKNAFDRAIDDYTASIQLKPRDGYSYYVRGVAYVVSGSPEKALPDLRRANELTPTNEYFALWLDIAERRSNVPSDLMQTAKQLDMKASWPAPIVKLFLGQLSPAAMFAAVDKTKSNRACQANFFGGEWALIQGAKDEARRLLQLTGDCSWGEAKAELRLLGASP